MSVTADRKPSYPAKFFDTARCRARIAGMQDEELEDYMLRLKARLANSHEDSYFLEESLLIQLGEACEERKRRQVRFEARRQRHRDRSHEAVQSAPGIGAD